MFKGYMPKIQFGSNTLESVGTTACEYGSKALLAADPFLKKTGVAARIETLLNASGISVVLWTDIQPNPSCVSVDAAGKLARESGVEMVVAAGGGSAIDFGKAVAVVAANPGSCWEYTERSDHEGGTKRPGKVLPVIAIPTTSGTGSEATPFAVLNNTDIHEKSTIVNDRIYTKEALIDANLMASMPPRLTASTGFDAFAHCVESYISLAATPFSRMTAMEGMKTIVKYLPRAVRDGSDLEARERMAWGSFLGGAAIATIGVALPHSLGQPVGGFCNAPHGESVAACMVEVLKDSYDAAPEAFATITDILYPDGSTRSISERAADCPTQVQNFLDAIGLHVRFRDFGLTEADIPKVTHIALTGYYFDIQCHPKKVTEDDIVRLYHKCL